MKKEEENIKLELLKMAINNTHHYGHPDINRVLKNFEILVEAYNKQIIIK
jgi:hypothetical protein